MINFDDPHMKLAMYTLDLAKYHKVELTERKLQAVIYMAFHDYLLVNGETEEIKAIYSQPFNTTPYGPKMPDITARYNMYIDAPIPNYTSLPKADYIFYRFMRPYLEQSLFKDVWQLLKVELSDSFYTQPQRFKYIQHNDIIYTYELADIATKIEEPKEHTNDPNQNDRPNIQQTV